MTYSEFWTAASELAHHQREGIQKADIGDYRIEAIYNHSSNYGGAPFSHYSVFIYDLAKNPYTPIKGWHSDCMVITDRWLGVVRKWVDAYLTKHCGVTL